MDWPNTFVAKVNKTADCWFWTGAQTKGYGQFVLNKRHGYAHRFAWEFENGPIPAGKVICHACDTPLCVRPSHLFCGTAKDNVADKIAKGRAKTGVTRGAANASVKVKDINAGKIIDMFNEGMKCREIGPVFGISKSTVSNILRGQHWSMK